MFCKAPLTTFITNHETQEAANGRDGYKFQSPTLDVSHVLYETKALDFKGTHVRQCLQILEGIKVKQGLAQLDKLYYFNHHLATSLNTYAEREEAQL